MAMLLELPKEMTIAETGTLWTRFKAALLSGDEVLLDGRGVAHVDIAGLQLIEVAWSVATARGSLLSFAPNGRSPVLEQAAVDAGLCCARVGGVWAEAEHG